MFSQSDSIRIAQGTGHPLRRHVFAKNRVAGRLYDLCAPNEVHRSRYQRDRAEDLGGPARYTFDSERRKNRPADQNHRGCAGRPEDPASRRDFSEVKIPRNHTDVTDEPLRLRSPSDSPFDRFVTGQDLIWRRCHSRRGCLRRGRRFVAFPLSNDAMESVIAPAIAPMPKRTPPAARSFRRASVPINRKKSETSPKIAPTTVRTAKIISGRATSRSGESVLPTRRVPPREVHGARRRDLRAYSIRSPIAPIASISV